MATINDMLNNVKENLGNRSSGVIGGTPVDTVVLSALNKGFTNTIKMANPTYYDRFAELSLIVGQVDYPEPVVDVGGLPIRIKQVISSRLTLTGETDIYITRQIVVAQYLQNSVPSLSETGVPSTYCYHNRIFKFTRYPEDTYDFTMAVKIYPQVFGTGELNEVLMLDEMWYETIEAYATHHCFSKLQLTQNAAFWYTIYDESKRQNKAVINKQPGISKPTHYFQNSGDPVNDPFVRRFN